MASIEKLLKYLESDNVADFLDDDEAKQVVEDVVTGYCIDEESRRPWLETNKEAMKIIKNAERSESDPEREFPFYKSSKVIYPLLSPAIIQLSSRLIQHIVRNDKVAECVVLGQDEPEINPETGQPTGQGIKQSKASRVSDFMSYEFLIESDTWLLDQHKVCTILSSWGMAFKEVYYDKTTKKNCSEFLQPEDVVINHNTTSLDKCRRITIRNYMTKNDILTEIRSGRFLDIDIDSLNTQVMENEDQENDSREVNPVYEVLKQFCYLDLDDDELAEPYYVYVHQQSQTLLGIRPAFELTDVQADDKGKIIQIEPRMNIVDYHLIDDPEGKFYSLGLNHLLIHQNKAITAVLRQLLDAGTLANQQGGFITKAFKTKERSLRFKLGEFKVIDVAPGVDPRQQIIPLPFKEPSQVLLALLQMLVESGKETGFMTDVLAGDAQAQNVPATSMLAMVEQATRAFKPVVQKFFTSEKKEFKLWFHFHSKYLDRPKYYQFQGKQGEISMDDFDEKNLDVVPVADPTMSSEAHKYARLQAMVQFMQSVPGALNVPQAAATFMKELQFVNVEALVAQPQPAAPDPKLMEIQLKAQIADKNHEIAQLKQALVSKKLDLEAVKVDIKQQDVDIKKQTAKVQNTKMIVDAHKESMDAVNQQNLTKIEGYNAETERKRINILEKQQRDSNNSSGNSD